MSPALAVEWDEPIADLYRSNFGGTLIVQDIESVASSRYLLHKSRSTPLVIQSSPSCKQYSLANKDRDGSTDDANALKATFDWYSDLLPEFAILENVIAYRSAPVYLEFLDLLKNLGYTIQERVLNSKDFGVAQNRERLFLIASALGQTAPQISILPHEPKGWLSAIEDLIPQLKTCEPTRGQLLALDLVDPLGSYLVPRIGYYGKHPRAVPDCEPAPTIRASLADDLKGGRRSNFWNILHKETFYVLDGRCMARLQGFPDSYQLSGDIKIDIRGIGNSVSPPVMKAICDSLLTP
jgi:DNA (cytosine-5)-methyltransferase 1